MLGGEDRNNFFAASGGKRECIAVAMNRTEVYEKKGVEERERDTGCCAVTETETKKKGGRNEE